MIARALVACAFAVAIGSPAFAVGCPTTLGGGARIDINGNVQCAGGCRDGSAQFCDGLIAAPGTAAAR
jgi:hypothetical protein